jgi:hypothetical protein
MPKLQIEGETIDIADSEFFKMISHLAEGNYNLARVLFGLHYSGFCDVDGDLTQHPETPIQERIRLLRDQIGDKQLQVALDSLQGYVDELIAHDLKFVEWLATYSGIGSPSSKKARSRLRQNLTQITDKGPDGSPQGPIWRANPEFQALIHESEVIIEQIESTKQEFDLRLEFLQNQLNDGQRNSA